MTIPSVLSGLVRRVGGGRAVLVALAVAASVSVARAAPAGEEGPPIGPLQDMTVTGPLSAGEKKKVDDYVRRWCEIMANAQTLEVIVKARRALDNGYLAQVSAYYTVEYVRSLVDSCSGTVLKQANPVKQIQIAMSAAGMSQYTVQPMLERMSVHPNAGVRYWAVRGYGAAAKRIADQDAANARTMFATLQRMGLKEPSGALLGAVLAALAPPAEAGPEHVAAAFKALDVVWQARCADIQAGKADAIDAYQMTIGLLQPTGEDDKKAVLQLLTDSLEAGTLALLRKDCWEDPPAGALTQLLITGETKLVELTGSNQTPIQAILNNTRAPIDQRAIQVRLAFNTQWKPVLAKSAVKTRVKPLPATAPATAAAAATE